MGRSLKAISIVSALVICCSLICSSCGGGEMYIATVNGQKVSYDMFVYNLISIKKTLLNNLGAEDSESLWAISYGTSTYGKYAIDSAVKATVLQTVVELKYDELGLSISDEDMKTFEKNFKALVEYYGGTSAYNKLIGMANGASVDKQRRLYDIKYNQLMKYVFREDGDNPVTEAEKKAYLNENCVRVKQILLNNVDENGFAMSEEQMEIMRRLASSIMAGSKDDTTFENYAVMYNCDAYADVYTTGYVFEKDGSDSLPFTDQVRQAALGLENVGDMTIVEDKDGIHILRKYDLFSDSDFYSLREGDALAAIAGDRFQQMIWDWASKAEIVYNEEAYKNFNVAGLKVNLG